MLSVDWKERWKRAASLIAIEELCEQLLGVEEA